MVLVANGVEPYRYIAVDC